MGVKSFIIIAPKSMEADLYKFIETESLFLGATVLGPQARIDTIKEPVVEVLADGSRKVTAPGVFSAEYLYTEVVVRLGDAVGLPLPSPPKVGITISLGESTIQAIPPQQVPLIPARPSWYDVSMAQARCVLASKGLVAKIDAMIKLMPEPQKTFASTGWEYSATVSYDGAFVSQLFPLLGLGDADRVALFQAASKVKL
jgi:hypothetical protein